MRTPAEDARVTELLREYDKAMAGGGSMAGFLADGIADELLELGVDVTTIRGAGGVEANKETR